MKRKFFASILTAVIAAAMMIFPGCGKSEPQADTTNDDYRVFYQIFVGSFSDSDGDGTGDLQGIINRFDYLNDGDIADDDSLGVQGIWLSPIFSSPTYHKYDTTNYYKVDSSFGTEDDLKELIALCKERNVKLILDLAINHTSTSNSWFTSFKKARQNGDRSDKYYDYYSCVTESQKVSGCTYYQISGTEYYYEANFDSGMPELNYDNEAVYEEMVNVAKYYLDLGVDGFRFDAIKYIYYGDDDASAAFWEKYIADLKEIKSDIYTVGECWSSDSATLKYYSALNCFNFTSGQQTGYIASAANYGEGYKFANYVESYLTQIKEQNESAMYCPFIANHDMDRAAGFLPVSTGKMQMAANLYILCSGSPFIYYGEEIGMKGSRGSANTDANRRLAMLWGDGDTVKNPTGSTFSSDKQTNGTVADQLNDKDSLLNYYHKLIALRIQYPAIARGDYKALSYSSEVAAFEITYNDSVLGLFHNCSSEEITITLPASLQGTATLGGYIGSGSAKLNGNELTIGALTSVVIA